MNASFRKNRRWLKTGTALVVSILALSAIHSVADASKIGDLMSPVDRAFEAVSSTVSLSPESRSKKQLELFNERQLEGMQIVMENPRAACGPISDLMPGADRYQHLLTALSLSQRHLAKAEAEAMQVGNLSARENALANIAESINYQLRAWNTLSPFVPKEGESGLLQTAVAMEETLLRVLAQLPETRQVDIRAQLNVDAMALLTSIQLGFTECGTGEAAVLEGAAGSSSRGGSATRTSGSTSTTTTGTSGTTVIRTETGVIRTVNIPFPTSSPTSFPTPTPAPTGTSGSSGFNLNTQTDMGPGLNVGIGGGEGLVIEPNLNLTNPENIGLDADVNDQNVVDTNACPGIQLLGLCLTQ